MSLRVFSLSHGYRSHARVAHAYMRIVDALPDSVARLVSDPDEANVSYIHTEPYNITNILSDFPSLENTYKIGFCVWETDVIPPDYAVNIALFDEVWTASLYNWLSFSRVHPRVRWVPHVTGGLAQADAGDVEALRVAIGINPDDFCYLFIGKNVPRKNISALRDAFKYVVQRRPHARLLVKTQDDASMQTIQHEGRIAQCQGNYSSQQIASLYSLCSAYVSPHCSEGWGLTLSDAMAYGRLCVGTAHSGNMDFMTGANSLPIACTIVPIPGEHRHALMREGMQWAYPHPESLEHQMLAAYDETVSGQGQARVALAMRDIRCFDARHIRVLIRHRLRRIAERLGHTNSFV